MQSPKLLFEITGNIKRPEIDNKSESDLENEIDREYLDFEIVDLLNKESESIQKEIEEEIRFGLKKHLPVENISATITFENGSIIATGLIVIDLFGKISGAIAFFEYANRLVKLITERTIKNVLRRRIRNSKFIVNIQAIPINTPEELPVVASTTDSSANIFNIPSSKLLIYITLINIMFFVGGTLFNLFQVDSVQKRYNDANQKYLEVKTKYDSASQLVAYAKIKYQADMESVVSDVMNKKLAILTSLSSDTISISSDIALLNAKNKRLDLEIESVNKEIAKSQQSLKEINETIKKEVDNNERSLKEINDTIKKLRDNKTKFGFIDSWNFMNVTLKIIVSLLLLISLSSVIIIIVGLIKNRS